MRKYFLSCCLHLTLYLLKHLLIWAHVVAVPRSAWPNSQLFHSIQFLWSKDIRICVQFYWLKYHLTSSYHHFDMHISETSTHLHTSWRLVHIFYEQVPFLISIQLNFDGKWAKIYILKRFSFLLFESLLIFLKSYYVSEVFCSEINISSILHQYIYISNSYFHTLFGNSETLGWINILRIVFTKKLWLKVDF